ncbi:MAG: histidinol-phosphatase HisJ family protein [Clostridiales bacterium]|jgi:histidinol-phosphatase (PHP family)|nr:histidinol-phosphatase HisJ family protein [Clostridiales bacterium]
MKYPLISDSHVHSDSSRDANDPVMMMCESAARLGFYSITITDHCECNVYHSEFYDRSTRQSYFETRKAAMVFNSRLHVYAGVELGQAVQDQAAAEDILNACDFDFVLASVHNIRNFPDFYEIDYNQVDVDDILNRYFDELLETIAWGKFDSLAHLTYPWRYLNAKKKLPINMYKKRIDEVLNALIAKNKALEINTSGLRQKLGTTMPDLPILTRYRELGGKLITIGSDAHRWADVGGGIEQGFSILCSAGFHHFTVYQHHEPIMLPIE